MYQGLKRSEMRGKYGIKGDTVVDIVGACFCPCCGIMQEEKESLLRSQGVDAKTGAQYQAPGNMQYP